MNILLKKITFGINIFSPESGRKNTCFSVIFKFFLIILPLSLSPFK